MWVYIIIVIGTYVFYKKVDNFFKHRATYAKERVNRLKQAKKSVWEKIQKEVDPTAEPEDLGKIEESKKNEKKNEFKEENKKPDKREFKKIFGMDTLPTRPSCNTGG